MCKTFYGTCKICGNKENAMKNDNICIICFLDKTNDLTYKECISESQAEIEFIKKFGLKSDKRKINKGVKNKMERTRHVINKGGYLTVENVDEGKKGDNLIIKIISEGELEPSKFSNDERLVIEVEGDFTLTDDEKGNDNITDGMRKFNLSPTNENTIQELFGFETMDWIGKKIKILIESCNVGKKGKMITVSDKIIE